MNDELQQAMQRMESIKKTLLTLEWDLKQNKLNPGKKEYYDELKREYENISSKMKNFNGDGAFIENEDH